MQEKTKNKLKFVGYITNAILLIVALFVSFSLININYDKSQETIAKFNGTIYAGNQQSNKVSLY